MRRMTGWLALAAVLILLLAACGPEMDTSTPSEEVAEAPATATAAQEDEPVGESANEPTDEPTDVSPDEAAEPAAPSTGSDDWHSLGSPDAPVTIIEYSDFQ